MNLLHPPKDSKRWRPVQSYDADELHAILIDDAVRLRIATPLSWVVDACERIAELKKISIEEAFVRVKEEIEAKTETPMPIG